MTIFDSDNIAETIIVDLSSIFSGVAIALIAGITLDGLAIATGTAIFTAATILTGGALLLVAIGVGVVAVGVTTVL